LHGQRHIDSADLLVLAIQHTDPKRVCSRLEVKFLVKRKSSAQDLLVWFGAESRIHGIGLVRDQVEILVPRGGNKVQSREFALIGPVGKGYISRSIAPGCAAITFSRDFQRRIAKAGSEVKGH
jgi:hypothetical protein